MRVAAWLAAYGENCCCCRCGCVLPRLFLRADLVVFLGVPVRHQRPRDEGAREGAHHGAGLRVRHDRAVAEHTGRGVSHHQHAAPAHRPHARRRPAEQVTNFCRCAARRAFSCICRFSYHLARAVSTLFLLRAQVTVFYESTSSTAVPLLPGAYLNVLRCALRVAGSSATTSSRRPCGARWR
jgi:hypothetical protein